MPKISPTTRTKAIGANDAEVPGGYPLYPRPYFLTLTQGGSCRGYVYVSSDMTYRVVPTPEGFNLERLHRGGSTGEKITKTVRYKVDTELKVSPL